jgi:DNA-binding transcriptional ArsR family regulator
LSHRFANLGSGATEASRISAAVRRNGAQRLTLVKEMRETIMPSATPQLAEVAHLVADAGRANILSTLMDGRALGAGELARVAGVTPQTASSHLSKLVEGALLTVEKRGPRRFYRLSGPLVAQMLEGIMNVAAAGAHRWRPPRKIEEEMQRARTCYDHLAGRLGVAIADAMVERDQLVLEPDAGELTPFGRTFLADLGIDFHSPSRRSFCRPCLDWSERRPHVAGRVGAAIADLAFRRGWIRRRQLGRSLDVTGAGVTAFRDLFGVRI